MTPRPRNFDEATALNSAKELFWSQGFEATSMQNLVDAMKIGRQSLYNTFGDKRTLFLKALELYQEELQESAFTPLNRPTAALAEVAEFLDLVASGLAGQKERRACLLMNSVLELSATDDAVREVATKFRNSLIASLESALTRAAAEGFLAHGTTPEDCAKLVANTAMGLSLTWKSGATEQELYAIVRTTVALVAKDPAALAAG